MIKWSAASVRARQLSAKVGKLTALLLRVASKAMIYLAPWAIAILALILLVLLPFVAAYAYLEVPQAWREPRGEFAEIQRIIVALGGFSLVVGMVVNGLRGWLKALKDIYDEHAKMRRCLPRGFDGLELQDELKQCKDVFSGTSNRVFRALGRSVWAFLLVTLLGVLASIVPTAKGGREVVMLTAPIDCCGEPECPRCSECPTCSLMPGGLETNMEFLLVYPYYRRNEREDGIELSASNAYWLDIIKRRASACSTDKEKVKLKVRGFASDQRMNPPEDKAMAERSNCGVANARSRAVVEYFSDGQASWKKIRKKDNDVIEGEQDDTAGSTVEDCGPTEGDEDGWHETMGRVGGGNTFIVERMRWSAEDSMVEARNGRWNGDSGHGDRLMFRHRSVLIVVENAGTCSRDEDRNPYQSPPPTPRTLRPTPQANLSRPPNRTGGTVNASAQAI